MPMRKTAKQLVDEANAEIECVPASDAIALAKRDDVVVVDLRDIRERVKEGFVPHSVHAPRGMLEFWVDPASPYHKPLFADESREFILFCGAGWRSALAARALQDMGMTNVAHIEGGWAEWVKAGAPTETLEAQKARRKKKD